MKVNLSKCLERYKNEIDLLLEDGSKEIATKSDLKAVAIQVFYLLDDFKNAIENM